MPQFCPVLSKETLLEQTLQRAALLVLPDRTPSLFALTSASAPPHHDRGDRTDAFTGRQGLSPAIRAQGPDQAMILCVRVRVSTRQEEAVFMGSHSKTNRAVQRLRRLARRRREADLKKEQRSGSDRRSSR